MADSNIGADHRQFPNDNMIAPLSENKGSGPTAENPAGVHPEVDPSTGHYPPEQQANQQGPSMGRSIENPYALQEALGKVQAALDGVIELFQSEGSTLSSDGDFGEGKKAIKKFQAWRAEIEEIKRGKE